MPQISDSAMTPMLRQYLDVKAQYPDCILFYRMGDFYEMFLDDAERAAPILDLQLTSRDKRAEDPIPMAGVPYHSASAYVQKLLAVGLKVAICDQMEPPSKGKALVRREVVRVLTPSLVGDPDLVSEDSRPFLYILRELSDGSLELLCADMFAGTLKQGVISSDIQLGELPLVYPPKEILLHSKTRENFKFKSLYTLLGKVLITERDPYFSKHPKDLKGVLAEYLNETQKTTKAFAHFAMPQPLFEDDTLSLDATTLISLEVLRGAGNPPGESLYDCLNRTTTPMGRRLLKDWLSQPLANLEKIEERHGGVAELMENRTLGNELSSHLSQIRDLERLSTKAAIGLAMPKDLVAIREIQKRISEIKLMLVSVHSSILRQQMSDLDPLVAITQKLEGALLEQPANTLREGGIFRDTYHQQIEEYRSLSRDAKGTIASMELRERERTSIPNLKIKFNKVFGYTIEITNSHLGKVPKDYIRKQTISTGERFITEELKHFEDKVIHAEHRLKVLEESLFIELRNEIAAEAVALLKNARAIAVLDVLLGFAEISFERNYARPTLTPAWDLNLVESRHPVIERILEPGKFVPNDIEFSQEDCRTLLITGPNMAGKSTIMRQVALALLMAQAGCFVAAKSAHLPVVDAIFTRVGSSDDLARGQSTFMVEMSEMARILERATPRSFILIDEIGRGTSTYDGLSLAWALLEFLHHEIGAKTLFATHFHELTYLEKSLPGLKNINILVDKWKDGIVFLHKLGPGICSRSYGIEVAQLAGLPSKVLVRAKHIMGSLETHSQRGMRVGSTALQLGDKQMAFFESEIQPEISPSIEH